MVRAPAIQHTITRILESEDPEAALGAELAEDPKGLGRVAELVYSIIDKSREHE